MKKTKEEIALDKSTDILLKYLAKWVELRGGKILVAGNIHTIVYPNDLEYNFTIGIKCTGRKPKAKDE